MDGIKFADGTVMECSYLATDGQGSLWIVLNGLDPAESVSILSDTDKTEEMEWNGYRLIGYTNLTFVMIDPNVGSKCCLKGGHDERI